MVQGNPLAVFTSPAAEIWQTVVNTLSEGLLIIDYSERVIWANNSAVQILRVPHESLIGSDIRAFEGQVFYTDGSVVPYDRLPLIDSLRTGATHSGVTLGMLVGDEEHIYLRINSQALVDELQPHQALALVSFIDITEQVYADTALKNNEAKYRLLTENSSDIISVGGGDAVFRYVSPAVKAILGYEPHELIGQSAIDFIHPTDQDRVVDRYRSAIDSGSGAVTFRFRNSAGSYRCLENTIRTIIHGEAPETTELVSISRDVTERMKMEGALRQSEEKYRTLFDHASESIYIHELFGKIIEVNSVAIERLGYSREELCVMTPADIQRTDFRAEYPVRMSTLLSEHSLVYETVHVRKNGTSYPTELSLSIIDYDGRRMVMSIGRDITDRKRLEQERERSLGLLQATIESTADGILVVSNESDIITHNKRFEEMWNLPENWKSLGSWEDRMQLLLEQVSAPSAFLQQIQQLYASPQEQSYDIIELVNGRVYERYSIPFKLGEQHLGRSWSFRDITERRQAELELRQSRAHLKAIFDHAGVAIGLLDTRGDFVIVNERWAALFGVSREEICNCDPMAFSHPEDFELGKQNLQEVLDGTSSGYRMEKRYVRADGTILWGDLLVTPLLDDEGKLHSVLGVISDITESKLGEQKLQQTNRELQHRNEELDAFAHTVAHDLRNPLGIILGYGLLIRDHKDDLSEEEIAGIQNGMLESASKMQEIIESLLLLSQLRSEEVARHSIDMKSVVAEAMKHVERIADERHANIEFPDAWPASIGYQPWIEEVWANYLSNAIKYGGTPPTIALGADTLESGHIRFWIRDNGQGIRKDQQEKLFNKFIRFNANMRDGQGLGLSIVRRIVEKLGGHVGVESTPGEGSEFFFTLPATNAHEKVQAK